MLSISPKATFSAVDISYGIGFFILIAVAFKINREKNNKYIIFIAINIYSLIIDNNNIRLLI